CSVAIAQQHADHPVTVEVLVADKPIGYEQVRSAIAVHIFCSYRCGVESTGVVNDGRLESAVAVAQKDSDVVVQVRHEQVCSGIAVHVRHRDRELRVRSVSGAELEGTVAVAEQNAYGAPEVAHGKVRIAIAIQL